MSVIKEWVFDKKQCDFVLDVKLSNLVSNKQTCQSQMSTSL